MRTDRWAQHGVSTLCGCRIAEAVCGKIATKVLKQRPNTVQRGSDILLTMIELGQAENVVVRASWPAATLPPRSVPFFQATHIRCSAKRCNIAGQESQRLLLWALFP